MAKENTSRHENNLDNEDAFQVHLLRGPGGRKAKVMDEPITKRLIISGLTPAISAEDISRRLTSFGTVKAADGFGSQNAVGQPRKFGYVTLETTVGKLSKCMNLFSGSTWKGAKLRFGEAKPDFAERIAAENKKAAEEPESPKKKRRRHGGVLAEDMSLVTPENVAQKPGWKVSSVGRITYPVKIRPSHPLGEPLEETKVKQHKKAGDKTGEKKKKKRVKDPDTRARRKVIDMSKYGSTHLKGMFLDLEVSATRNSPPAPVHPDLDTSSSESEPEVVIPAQATPLSPRPLPAIHEAGPSKIHPDPLPSPPKTTKITPTNPDPSVLEEKTTVQQETAHSLNLLKSLFGQDDDDDWIGRESVGSDIDVDELVKGHKMLEDDGRVDFEVVPREAIKEPGDEDEIEDSESSDDDKMVMDELEPEHPSRTSHSEPKPVQKTSLKDLFAPREDEGGFSLLGHLDLDLELDEDAPFLGEEPMEQQQSAYETSIPSLPTLPTPSTTHNKTTHAPLVLNPRQVLFFPLPPHESSGMRARQKDVFDLAKDNRWNWRDPAVGFYRTGTEEDIKKRWEESKGDLTRDWKRRCREASKVNRRKKGGVEDAEI